MTSGTYYWGRSGFALKHRRAKVKVDAVLLHYEPDSFGEPVRDLAGAFDGCIEIQLQIIDRKNQNPWPHDVTIQQPRHF
jgi:hypothetical protein